MHGESKLCLEGELAKPFMKHRVGDRVPIHLDTVLVRAEMMDDYNSTMPMEAGKPNKKPPPKKPRVEFVLRSVNGKGEDGKHEDEDHDYANMSSEKYEKHVAKNRGYSGNG